MENLHERPLPLPQTISPNSSNSSTSHSPSSSSSSNNGSAAASAQSPQPPTHKSTPRSIDATNPYPTTFIQADSSSFKQVVQMLTGSPETAAKGSAAAAAAPPSPKSTLPPAARATGPKKPAFKLYERRRNLKNLKMISPLLPLPHPMGAAAGSSPRLQLPEILSPSVLDFPSLRLSPVTPLIPDLFNRSPQTNPAVAYPAMSAEERAIAQKGFYLHPSPRRTPRDSEPPRLLPLFPETSPRMSQPSTATATAGEAIHLL